jgi:hypothetical protein
MSYQENSSPPVFEQSRSGYLAQKEAYLLVKDDDFEEVEKNITAWATKIYDAFMKR